MSTRYRFSFSSQKIQALKQYLDGRAGRSSYILLVETQKKAQHSHNKVGILTLECENEAKLPVLIIVIKSEALEKQLLGGHTLLRSVTTKSYSSSFVGIQ